MLSSRCRRPLLLRLVVVLMATYVISDIHGCYDEFMTMLRQIQFSPADKMYVLGDIIDHGPDSAKLIKWFVNRKPINIELMLGNHEDMMYQDTRGDYVNLMFDDVSTWAINRGMKTRTNIIEGTTVEDRRRFFNMIAHSDVAKLIDVNGLQYILVHAGLMMFDYRNLDDLLDHQTMFDMLWIRNEWLCDKHRLPCPVIFGHTATPMIMTSDMKNGSIGCALNPANDQDGHIIKWQNKIAIDCGAAYGYNLGCLRLEDMHEFYVPCFGVYR